MTITDKDVNFFRLIYVMGLYGTKALRELLQYLITKTCPSTPTLHQLLALPAVKRDLQSPGRKYSYLDPRQSELLYPGRSPSTTITLEEIDISLAVKLLKRVSVFSSILNQPSSSGTLWEDPTEAEKKNYPIETSIALMLKIRNFRSHNDLPTLSSKEYTEKFDTIKSAIVTIMNEIGSTAISESDIEQLRAVEICSDVRSRIDTMFMDEYKDEMKEALESTEARLDTRLQQILVYMQTVSKNAAVSNNKSKRFLYCLVVGLFIVVTVFLILNHKEMETFRQKEELLLEKTEERNAQEQQTDQGGFKSELDNSIQNGKTITRVKLTQGKNNIDNLKDRLTQRTLDKHIQDGAMAFLGQEKKNDIDKVDDFAAARTTSFTFISLSTKQQKPLSVTTERPLHLQELDARKQGGHHEQLTSLRQEGYDLKRQLVKIRLADQLPSLKKLYIQYVDRLKKLRHILLPVTQGGILEELHSLQKSLQELIQESKARYKLRKSSDQFQVIYNMFEGIFKVKKGTKKTWSKRYGL